LEFFKKHKILILRSAGALMLLIGFVVHFWVIPKEGISKNEIAAANIARMEAKVAGKSNNSSKKQKKKEKSKYMQEFKNHQAKQVQYLTIIAMILGVGSLGYSFIKKKEPNT
jgi:hypothetical protein